jgi:hypothetical protein
VFGAGAITAPGGGTRCCSGQNPHPQGEPATECEGLCDRSAAGDAAPLRAFGIAGCAGYGLYGRWIDHTTLILETSIKSVSEGLSSGTMQFSNCGKPFTA